MFRIKLNALDLIVLLILAGLLFSRRLPRSPSSAGHLPKAVRPPAPPQPPNPVLLWLFFALGVLWREFYYWTIGDWE